VITISLSPADLADVRFAISPLWEAVAGLRALRDPGIHAVHLPWVREHRAQVLGSADFPLLNDLGVQPARHLPGFLAPAPTSPVADFDDELEALVATPLTVVRAELAALYGDDLPSAAGELRRAPRQGLLRLAAELRAYWELAIEPHWERMRGLLEGDVAFRARELADRGPRVMFDGLDPVIGWHDGDLMVDLAHIDMDVTLGGRGLVLVPTLFGWPRVFVKTNEPWAPLVRYPARAVGALWETAPPASDLAPALGATRARLLTELGTPATTSDLARRTGLAPGGVSEHLRRLTASGLVARHRTGRTVVYARTTRGEALFA
jgi:DNA-binding transcriptional ArsR family regulator